MVKIERYAAKGVWDPPTYSQGVKVTGAQTILYLAGQVAYDDKGGTDLGPIREEFLGKKTCASTLVAVAALAMPEWLIEIEAVAVL